MNRLTKIAISSACGGIALCLNGCAIFGKERIPTETFRESLYREFPEPLDDESVDAFNIFWCINRPNWTAPSITCTLVDEAVRSGTVDARASFEREARVWPRPSGRDEGTFRPATAGEPIPGQ